MKINTFLKVSSLKSGGTGVPNNAQGSLPVTPSLEYKSDN